MNEQQSASILDVLQAAFPAKAKRTEACRLYSTLLADLDYETASKAVRIIIEDATFWPKWAEIKRAYNEQAAIVRKEAESAELAELLAEPTDEERQQQLSRMTEFIASRWGVTR